MIIATRSSPAADGRVARSAWLLVGAVLLLTALLTGLAVWLLYENQRERLHMQAASASQLDAEQAQAVLDAARFQVQATKRELLLRAEARHWLEHPEELQALLTEIERVSPQPSIFGLGAIDPSGRVLALSFQPEVKDLERLRPPILPYLGRWCRARAGHARGCMGHWRARHLLSRVAQR